MIDFPDSPDIGDEFQPPTSPFLYRWDGTVWTLPKQPFIATIGFVLQDELTGTGQFLDHTMDAGFDYEFEVIARPDVDDKQLLIRLANDGVTFPTGGWNIWRQTQTDAAAALVLDEANNAGVFSEAQRVAGAGQSLTCLYALSNHDSASESTMLFGRNNSQTSGGNDNSEVVTARFTAKEINNAIRFAWLDGASFDASSVIRVYRRKRIPVAEALPAGIWQFVERQEGTAVSFLTFDHVVEENTTYEIQCNIIGSVDTRLRIQVKEAGSFVTTDSYNSVAYGTVYDLITPALSSFAETDEGLLLTRFQIDTVEPVEVTTHIHKAFNSDKRTQSRSVSTGHNQSGILMCADASSQRGGKQIAEGFRLKPAAGTITGDATLYKRKDF